MSILERIFGPPMAAIEQRFQRMLRYWLIAQLIVIALLAFFAKEVRETIGIPVGAMVLVAILAIIPAGFLWWKAKKAADDQAWDDYFSENENGK